MWWWIGHVLGLDDASGVAYLAWSGFVGDISLIGAALVVLRKHQCHVKRCWRLGHHTAGRFAVCRRHHPSTPDTAPTAAEVRRHVKGLER